MCYLYLVIVPDAIVAPSSRSIIRPSYSFILNFSIAIGCFTSILTMAFTFCLMNFGRSFLTISLVVVFYSNEQIIFLIWHSIDII